MSELDESETVSDDFELFVIFLNIDESGAVTSAESIAPVVGIGFDIESEECLFHVMPGQEAIKISEAYSQIEPIDARFSLVSALEQEVEDSWVRIDNPVIGFGENIDEKRFFVVCMA